ncbi:MAG: BtrH N-terminal domain-containing protein [bacterium]|nr:BtrH N-terminal domain-containing protein [bacterium]
MRKVIDDYRIHPGEHCGSASMRGLLAFYCDLQLPEDATFGLGAGLGSGFIDQRDNPQADYAVAVFGRTATFEVDLGRHLGIDYRERTEDDDDHAWAVVREEVLAGRPTMLAGDIFYLDYRDYKVNFPSHRFVLMGFDDEREEVYIGDRIREKFEICSLAAVKISRNAPTPMSDRNRWGRFHDTAVGNDLRTAAETAIRTCAASMLGENESSSFPGAKLGVEGTRAYGDALPSVAALANAEATASFNAPLLEKFGNGGGNFRRLYAGFLTWARALDEKLVPESAPDLCVSAADEWTAASGDILRARDTPGDPGPWKDAAGHIARAAELEETLFTRLADAVG